MNRGRAQPPPSTASRLPNAWDGWSFWPNSSTEFKRQKLCWRWALLLCLAGCQQSLPSSTPLGSGPLAGEPPGPSIASTGSIAETAPRASAEPVPREAAPKDVDPQTETDESERRGTDAGAATDATPSDKAPVIVSFSGDYSGFDTTLIRIQGEPERREDDPNAKLRIEQTAEALEVIIINSVNGDVLCTLRAVARGNRADIATGQDCFEATVDGGFVELNGEKVIFELKLSGTITTPDGERESKMDYRFEGKRK